MKLTAVITSRNDNYGGNLVERAILCLNTMVQSFDEVIYVDWNSPGQSLIEEIRSDLNKTGRLKHVVITREQAAEFLGNREAQPCCETWGRNVGIRRSNGDVIVSTNIDIIPPSRKRLDDFLADSLLEDTMYVAARRNIDVESVQSWTSPQETVSKLLGFYPPMEVLPYRGGTIQPGNDPWSKVNCCGDFQIAHRSSWYKIRGFEEEMVFRMFADTHLQCKAVHAGIDVVPVFHLPVFHMIHGSGGGGSCKKNNWTHFMTNVKETQNTENWGLRDKDLRMEII